MARILVDKLQAQGALGALTDAIMTPLMFLVSGTITERPQRGHRYNVAVLKPAEVMELDRDITATGEIDETASSAWKYGFIPMMHLPILGGWRKYAVVSPKHYPDTWHPGWTCEDHSGYSKIPVTGPVRLLLGTTQTNFFGLSGDGQQIPVEIIGEGLIGNGGQFSWLPLR